MLIISFLACTKVELWHLIVCIVVNGEKISKSHSDLDLFPTMPNIKLVRYNLFSYTIMCSNFMLVDHLLFEL